MKTGIFLATVAALAQLTTAQPHHKRHSHKGHEDKFAITYSPYNADGSCKTQQQVNSDFEHIPDSYGHVRIYGTDCEQTTTVGKAAKAKGMKIMAGVYDLSDVTGDVNTIISSFKDDWSQVSIVNIGNELVNSGVATAPEVVAAIAVARPLLQAAGFPGHLTTVDTFNQIIAYPELCQNSDIATANAHCFFDGSSTAQQCGSLTESYWKQVKEACGGKPTVITEMGYPYDGDANGSQVPSVANQNAALASLKKAFADKKRSAYFYTAFNDLWKTNNAYTYGAEQYWGIYSTPSNPRPAA